MKVLANNVSMLFKSMLFLAVSAIVFASCKKDHDDKPAAKAIEGLYVGKYGFDNDTPDQDYKLNIKTGGVIQEIGIHSGAVMAQGTWQKNGNTVTASFSSVFPPVYHTSISAAFDPATGKLTGTWGDATPTDGGKIDLKKQ
jgi:hypothetical protein